MFGVVGLVAFPLFSAIAIIAGIRTFKSTSWIGRVLAGISILLGVIEAIVADRLVRRLQRPRPSST